MKIFSALIVILLFGNPVFAMQKYSGNLPDWVLSAFKHTRTANCDSIILNDGRVILGRVIDSGTTTLTIRHCNDDKVEILDRLSVDRVVYGLGGSGAGSDYPSQRQRRKLIGWGIGLIFGSLFLAYPLLLIAVAISLESGPILFAIAIFFLLAMAFVAGLILLIFGLIQKFNSI